MQLDSRVFAAQWNTEGKPTIGMEQFCQNVHKLGGTECTEEEVEALFTKQLDANGGKKEVDMETLKAMMKGCLDAKEAAVQSEKRTAKLVAQKEAAAREVQGETKRKLEDDERRLDEKRLEAEAATLRAENDELRRQLQACQASLAAAKAAAAAPAPACASAESGGKYEWGALPLSRPCDA